ncbi:hypothetical protein Tco_0180864 [Tanacetum coccineum]
MTKLLTNQATLDEYMGVWFCGEVPDEVELRSMMVIFCKEREEMIESHHVVINHLEKVVVLVMEVCNGGGALGSLGALKASTHPVIDIFLYPLGSVEAAYALEVNAMRALDLVKAIGALDLVEVEEVGDIDVLGLSSLQSSSSLDTLTTLISFAPFTLATY